MDKSSLIKEYPNFRRITGTKLYRGSRPDNLNAKQKEILEQVYGIKCIVDLRSPKEPAIVRKTGRSQYENHNLIDILPRGQWSKVLWKECSWYWKLLYISFLPLILTLDAVFGTIVKLRVVQVYATLRGGLSGYNCDIIQYCGDKIRRALTLLSSEENVPALIVCNLGKDRTGLLVALIQSLCGVSEDIIAREYSLSKGTGEHYYKNLQGQIMDAKPETIRTVLRFIDHKYGSLPSYLEAIGLSQSMQNNLILNVKQ